jgi:hypothetical protein
MMLFVIGIKHPLNVAVQGPHDADAREHRRAARRRDQDQRFHCRLPLLLMFRSRRVRSAVFLFRGIQSL